MNRWQRSSDAYGSFTKNYNTRSTLSHNTSNSTQPSYGSSQGATHSFEYDENYYTQQTNQQAAQRVTRSSQSNLYSSQGTRSDIPIRSNRKSTAGHTELGEISSGLPNLGNTCYMNSTLQCLFNIKQLYKAIAKENVDENLSKVYRILVENAYSNSEDKYDMMEVVQVFKDHIGRLSETFSGNHQNDAHELLRLILEEVHKNINESGTEHSSKNYTEFNPTKLSMYSLTKHAKEWDHFSQSKERSILMSKVFNGTLVNEVTCNDCKNASYSFENIIDLPLDIPRGILTRSKSQGYSLANCLDEFVKKEIISEYNCPKCKKKVKSTRKTMIWRQPEVLIVQIKRFERDLYGALEVRKDDISFPLQGLDLSSYTHKENLKSCKGKYELIGVVDHKGSLNRGHYIAYVLNEKEKHWYQYDDERVKEVKLKDMEKYADGSETPYLLFYMRK